MKSLITQIKTSSENLASEVEWAQNRITCEEDKVEELEHSDKQKEKY
jgi:hypothetical protein